MTDLSFSQLSMEQQVERMTRLAEGAVAAYPIEDAKLRFIHHSMNAIYQVTARDGGKYSLRVHPEHWLAEPAIRSEAQLVRYIASRGLPVADVASSRAGRLVERVSHAEVPGERCCLVFRWLEGTQSTKCLTGEELLEAGRYLGHLHDLLADFRPPADFQRPYLDVEGIFGPGGLYVCPEQETLFSPERRALFQEALAGCKERLAPFCADRSRYRLLHGDYYYLNWMFQREGMATLDYDLCGWGPELFDLVLPYWPAEQGNLEAAEAVFLRGYASVRPVPHGYAECRESFLCIRQMMDAYWVTSRQDLPSLRACTEQILEASERAARAYLKRPESPRA